MGEERSDFDVSPDGRAKIDAVDDYLEAAIRNGRPIEALIATRRLGEIVSERSRAAARAATEGSWSWADVGDALGISKQAAHEKLRTRVQGEIAKGRAKLERAEKEGHAKIARRAGRARDELDKAPSGLPEVEVALERVDEWERRHHDKLDRDLAKGREKLEKAGRSVEDTLARKGAK